MNEKIERAIAEFHNKVFPEVIVRHIGEGNNKLAFFFTGPFCFSCGLSDYFDDFSFILSKHLGERYIVEDRHPLNDGDSGWIVIYVAEREENHN